MDCTIPATPVANLSNVPHTPTHIALFISFYFFLKYRVICFCFVGLASSPDTASPK